MSARLSLRQGLLAAWLLAAATGAASAQSSSGTEVTAWLGRTVRPGSDERIGFYLWGATGFEVQELLVPNDMLEGVLRDNAVAVDLSRLTLRRTVSFTGEQGELAVSRTSGLYVYAARATGGTQGGVQAQAVLVSGLSLAVKRDDETSIGMVYRGEDPARGALVTVLSPGTGAAARVAESRATSSGLVIFATPANGPLLFLARLGRDVAIQQTWDRAHFAAQQRFVVHAQTDRPLYRPGQVVSFRAILRETLRRSNSYRTPVNEPVRVFLRDPRGGRVEVASLTTGQFGTVEGSLTLSAAASLGEHALELEVGPAGPNGNVVGTTSFGVEEYRKPEFRVTVTPSRPSYVQGETVQATVAAEYYFGAAVPGADVHYTVSRRYRWRWWNPWLDVAFMRCMPPFGPWSSEVVAQGDLRTGQDGTVAVSFAAPREDRDGDYVIEARVVDASDREVSGSGAVTVMRAAFDLVVRAERGVYRPGDTMRVQASLVGLDGSAVAGASVRFRVDAVDAQGRRTYRFARTRTTLADGTASLVMRAQTKGQYVVTARARDAAGNEVTSEVWLWIHDQRGGADYATAQAEVVADRETYSVGDRARLLVRAPVSFGRGLLTIEGTSIQSAISFPIMFGLGLVEVEVTRDMVPNVFASVIVPSRDGLVTVEKELSVPPVDEVVDVTVTADRAEYRPGEQATFRLRAVDRFGRPVRAEIALGVVDEALFGLREDETPRLLDTFYAKLWWNEVTTVGAAGGSGGGFFRPMRLTAATLENKSAAGTGGARVREYFPDTLRWVASVVTDANGEATITETLADSLTTWRLTARAVTEEARLGETRTTVLVRKDLIVRLALPRTLVEGDEVQVVGIVHNLAAAGTAGADPSAQVRVRLDAEGVTIVGPASRTVSVARGDLARLTWTVRVLQGTRATFTASADAAFDQDALRLELPVAARGVPAPDVEAGAMLADGTATLTLDKDPRAIDAASELRISLAPSLAGTMLDSLDYLVGFPYGCIEQTMSRFLPDVIVAETLRTLGRDDPRLTAELPEMVRTGVERIQGMQNQDGGFGWFGQNESHPYVSAYVCYGLALARRAGYQVPDALLDGVTGFLERSLASGTIDDDGRAYQLFALATAGRVRANDLVDVARRRAGLNDYCKAVLALALDEAGRTGLAGDVLADLDRSAIVTSGRCHWRGSSVHYGAWTSNPIETTAYVLRAYLELDPASPKVADAVAWLLERRRDDGQYTTTKDTAAVVLTLARYVTHTGELDPDLEVTVTVAGTTTRVRFTAADLARRAHVLTIPAGSLRSGANRVTVARSGRGALYYSAVLDQQVRLDPILAEDRGIAVRRELVVVTRTRDQDGNTVEQESPFTGRVRVGDRVRVKVTMTVSQGAAVEHVNLEDHFAAGFSVIDERQQGRGWSWWWSAREVHDDRVVFFATYLDPNGGQTYEYRYDLRAEVAGAFLALPARAEAVYGPETHGRSDALPVTIDPR